MMTFSISGNDTCFMKEAEFLKVTSHFNDCIYERDFAEYELAILKNTHKYLLKTAPLWPRGSVRVELEVGVLAHIN